ncbi:MAG: TIM barrel protein [candidate division Zixibacteria bacterium]|nr:TIM barrel protein [candidate division Zixibacteria bacterium]
MSFFDRIKNRLGYTETDPKIAIPEALQRAKELELSCVEMNLNFRSLFPERFDQAKLDEWGKMARDSDIQLSFHAPVDISLMSRHEPIRKASAERLCEFIELACNLNGERFTFHPGRAAFLKPAQDNVMFFTKKYPSYLVNSFLKSLTEIITSANQRIDLLIENTHLFDKPVADIIKQFAEENLIALAYDPAHGLSQSILSDYRKYIKVCHLNDRKGNRSHLALGDGEINIRRVIQSLMDTDAVFIIESRNIDEVRKSISYLKSRDYTPRE